MKPAMASTQRAAAAIATMRVVAASRATSASRPEMPPSTQVKARAPARTLPATSSSHFVATRSGLALAPDTVAVWPMALGFVPGGSEPSGLRMVIG